MKCSKTNEDVQVGQIYDLRHDPVIVRMPVESTATFAAGAVLKIGSGNGVEKAANADAASYYGVALEAIATAGENQYVNVLIHGVVRPKYLTKEEGALTIQDYHALKKAGIYAID